MSGTISNKIRLAAGAAAISLAMAAAVAMPSFGEWSAPAGIEALPGSSTNLNTSALDGCASLSPDGLTLAFNSNRTGNFDIYFAERSNTESGFGEPVQLPAPINSSAIDSCPTLLPGKRMIFTSFRDDPAGDLYETRLGKDGWTGPRRFGPNINQPGIQDEAATIYEDDEGHEIMLWSRRNAAQPGDIYQSIDEGPATLVQGGVNSSAADNRPSVTHDGRTIFWDSSRFGTLGSQDIWVATRSTTSEAWGQAQHLGALNSTSGDTRPSISRDGTLLTFSSARTGSELPLADIWFSERGK
jgi:Tol biopolymer transport system component